MRVLILGNGGREHALAWGLSRSSGVTSLHVAPGNPGIRELATCIPATGPEAWLAAADRLQSDLVVIGPEAPLVAGLADQLRARGHAVFGPGQDGARLEGDKAFAKDFLASAGIPTAAARAFHELDAALRHVDALDGPCVVKATGLAAGKGVSVCDDVLQAREAVRAALEHRVFGEAGATILVEERLRGPELSVLAVVDGKRCAWFAACRDHKRLLEHDEGPNTGGMGAYTPVAEVGPAVMQDIASSMIYPTVEELLRRGIDFRGLLYLGLMLTPQGPRVLEYNCRFGDPEAQVVIPTFQGDLAALLVGAARGELPVEGALPRRGAAVGIVLASEGYPAAPVTGRLVGGLAAASAEALVFHAGTRREKGALLTNGGRVVCVVGLGTGLPAALARARAAAAAIQFDGKQFRRDIAASATA